MAADPGDGGEQWVCQGSLLLRDLEERHRVYPLRAGADYKVNKQMTLGGQIGYDTFGDYNESTAGLYIRYMLGDH